MLALGCDTGLANFGAAVCEVDQHRQTVRLLSLHLFVSQALKYTVHVGKRGGLTKTRDTAAANFERLCQLGLWLERFKDAQMICFESMSTGTSVGAPASLLMGGAFGVLAQFSISHAALLEMHTPQQVKRAIGAGVGNGREAGKDQVHDLLLARFPSLDAKLNESFECNEFFGDSKRKKTYDAQERSHPCDALACIVATWPDYKVVT